MAPDPYTILVSERDTLILIYYPGVGTWHSDPYTILVPKRDIQSLYYLGVGTWHPIHIYYPVSERDTQSSISILVPERDTRSTNLILLVNQAFFYTKAS